MTRQYDQAEAALNGAIRQLWVAFSNLAAVGESYCLTEADRKLWVQVTKHPAVQRRLKDYRHIAASSDIEGTPL